MSTGFRFSGDTIDFDPGATVSSDDLVFVGDVPVICKQDGVSGDTITGSVRGVFERTLAAAAEAVQGEPAYYDAANDELTDDPAFPQVGTFWNNSTGATAYVKLGGGGGGAPDGGGEMAVVSHAFADGATLALADLGRDTLVVVDTQAGAVEVDLFTAVGNAGRRLVFKRAGTGVNAITIDPNAAETIDGGADHTALDAQHDSLEIVSDGANWLIVNSTIA